MAVMDDRPGQPGHRINRLGFKEIVPGQELEDQGQDASGADIPSFDLGHQMMARHRRVATANRKGPGKKNGQAKQAPGPDQGVAAEPVQEALKPGVVWAWHSSMRSNDLIAQIVARDIQRLRRGERVFA